MTLSETTLTRITDLYDRWSFERDYEDPTEYAEAMKKILHWEKCKLHTLSLDPWEFVYSLKTGNGDQIQDKAWLAKGLRIRVTLRESTNSKNQDTLLYTHEVI